MFPNVLKVLGIAGKEDVISNLLQYCLVVSPLFRHAFLLNICEIQPSDVSRVRVLTRVSTDSAGVPDLVVAVDDLGKNTLVILENKLKADEGKDQTGRYSSPECVRDIQHRLGLSGATVDVKFVFLALYPDQKPQAPEFKQVTYKNLVEAVRNLPLLEDSLAQLLLNAWMSLLEDFYSNAAISDEDFLLARLQTRDPLDGNYLYFKSFVQGISLQGGLEVENTFRSSAPGRRYYGAVISKPPWHPREMKEINGVYQLDAEQNFSIHFEPQFHDLKGVLELYLHYEVNPYQTKAWIDKHVSRTQYDAYTRVRERFIEALRSRGIPDLLIGGRSNQIAKARLQLSDATVTQARNVIAQLINRVAVHIDEMVMAKPASSWV